MAKIIGTSGAWKSICLELNNAGFYPEKISEISSLAEKATKEYELAKTNATSEIKNKIESLKKDLLQFEISLESDVEKCRTKISIDLELAQLAIEILQDGAGFIQKIVNYPRVKKHRDNIRLLKNKYKNCPQVFQKKISQVKKELEATQKNSDTLINAKSLKEKNKAELLQNAATSHDLAGATAELELIENLRTLPDNYYVLSDVNLEADKPIYFDGEWLLSAQVDHIVVSPSGIFVIEVKNWSKKFMQGGNYFDPYQQVKRASYLCYRLIGEKYNLKTRSIIAHKGYIPEKSSSSNAKVLALGEVRSYILWFKESDATDQDIENVVNWLAA